MLCGTGHPTHLARRLRIVVDPSVAATGVWCHMYPTAMFSPPTADITTNTVRNGREHGQRVNIDGQPPSQVGGIGRQPQHHRLPPHDTPTAAPGTT